MGRLTKFEVRENDDGQELHFFLHELDGTPYTIDGGSTVWFEAYLKGGTALLVEDTDYVTIPTQTGDDIGHCYYTTQVGDFDDDSAGEYWSRMRVDNITSTEIELEVLNEYSDGG